MNPGAFKLWVGSTAFQLVQKPHQVDGLDELQVRRAAQTHLDLGDRRDETAENQKGDHGDAPVDVIILEVGFCCITPLPGVSDVGYMDILAVIK